MDANVTSTASHKKKTCSSAKKRKAKIIMQDNGLTNVVNTFSDSAIEQGDLSKKLFADYDEVEKSSSVYEALGKVPAIDLNEQILISNRLVENKKKKKMDLVFSLLDEARARIVGLMLNDKM
ncbi:hypothetical protein Salat_0503800 [Sesamum alatum]|uniref:Uncharacterized protein n=1 Tax=Sesamum alatum TaxID=300844 RepID=A0AAE1Z3U3_9LAMI|nr:hypothetical protein Salat_0503800 [Sesamum alatum]